MIETEIKGQHRQTMDIRENAVKVYKDTRVGVAWSHFLHRHDSLGYIPLVYIRFRYMALCRVRCLSHRHHDLFLRHQEEPEHHCRLSRLFGG